MGSQEDHDLLIEINTNVKHLVKQMNDHISQDDEKHKDIENRVGNLEKDKAKILGGSFVLSVIAGFIGKFWK